MPQDPEDMLTDWQRRAEQQADVTLDLSRRMREVTASAESTGGEAVVTVDHSGGLAELMLTDRAMRLSADELTEAILTTNRRAQAKMAEKMGELVKGIYGPDSPTATFIIGSYTEQFPTPPDNEETR